MQAQLEKKVSQITSENEFFEKKSNEVENILLKCKSLIEEAEEQRPVKKLLDFCGGNGRFLESLILSRAFSNIHKIETSLIEPDSSVRILAVNRLAPFFDNKLNFPGFDLKDLGSKYNLIIANNVLQKMDNLRDKIVKLMQSLDYGGRMILTLKRFDHPILNLIEALSQNALMTGPRNSAMQLFHVLYEYGYYYDTHDVHSVLRFQNTEINRNKIVDFALGLSTNLYSEAIVNNFFDIHTFQDEVIIPLKDQIIVVHA
jgi:hypothetical protein